MAHHAHMTSDEWIEDWIISEGAVNLNPPETATVPPMPKGMVVANIKGGVYWATAEEVTAAYIKYKYAPTKILKALIERSGETAETVEFYKDTTTFEHVLILAWYDSSLNTSE